MARRGKAVSGLGIRVTGTGLAAVAFGAAVCLGAQGSNLVQKIDAEAVKPAGFTGKVLRQTDDAHTGEACYRVTGTMSLYGKEFFRVDPAKTYRLSGWFKSVGTTPSNVYLAFAPHDRKRRWIRPGYINPLKGTETTLVAACSPKDTVVKIADGRNWQVHEKYVTVAFGADHSGELRDLPNFDMSSRGITKVTEADGHWEVHLVKPCGKAYPAGTKVREHKAAATFIYCAAARKTVPAKWTRYSGTVTGMVDKGASPKAWWPGTAYARIAIYANFMQKKDAQVLIDDLTIEEVPPVREAKGKGAMK